jgi:hypothetical protein
LTNSFIRFDSCRPLPQLGLHTLRLTTPLILH